MDAISDCFIGQYDEPCDVIVTVVWLEVHSMDWLDVAAYTCIDGNFGIGRKFLQFRHKLTDSHSSPLILSAKKMDNRDGLTGANRVLLHSFSSSSPFVPSVFHFGNGD